MQHWAKRNTLAAAYVVEALLVRFRTMAISGQWRCLTFHDSDDTVRCWGTNWELMHLAVAGAFHDDAAVPLDRCVFGDIIVAASGVESVVKHLLGML